MRPPSFRHRPRRSWRKIAIKAPAGLTDELAAFLARLSGNGVAYDFHPADRHRATETLSVYLEQDDLLADKEQELTAFLDRLSPSLAAPLTVTSETIVEEDWNSNWKSQFQPFAITPSLVICPSWSRYRPEADEWVLRLDPGMAFGTGHHASTALALQLLETTVRSGPSPRRVLDVGCGTGILAMASALWGAETVTAIDNDPDAVTAARDNLRLNRLGKKVRVSDQPLAELLPPFEVVAANITAATLIAMAPALRQLLAPGGWLVLAGILAGEQEERVAGAYERRGLAVQTRRYQEEWAALLLQAPAREGECGGF